MTYKMNPELRKIRSPVTLIFPDSTEKNFESGSEIVNVVFDKRYVITEITAEDSKIRLELVEQQDKPAINWCGEETISFF